MKHKIYLIMLLIVVALIFFFWPGHPPYEFLMKTLGIESLSQGTQGQLSERDDFGCFYSCSFFPEGSKQMCEDWKAGKEVQWPPDCSMMQYDPCIKLCEFEKKAGIQSDSPLTTSAPEQKQAFNVLPSLIDAEFASDVNEEDKGIVITGISAMDFYLQKWFGKSINQQAGLRVNAGETTSDGGDSQVVVEDGKVVILISTGSPLWKNMAENNKYGGEYRSWLSAHEYVHVHQAHNGCGTGASKRLAVGGDDPSQNTLVAPRWFTEGEAELLSFKVMQEAGLISSWSSIQYVILPRAKQQVSLLKSFEKKKESGDSYSEYPLFAMAIDYLMKDRDIKTLDDFCANLAGGKGMNVPKAFETAFGISLDKFYEDFESYRKTW